MLDINQPYRVKLLLADLEPQVRQRIWRDAIAPARWRGGRVGCLSRIFVFALVWAAISVLFDLLPIINPLNRGYPSKLLWWGAIGWIAAFVSDQILRRMLGTASALRYVRNELRKMGRCAGCGYDLRGSPSRCPECGTVPADVA